MMQMEVTSELDREPDGENTIAEGYHEADDRRVEIEYARTDEGVDVTFTYFEGGDQISELHDSMHVQDGEINGGFWHGQSVEQFVNNHFNADPEAEVGEIFDDVLKQNS